MRHIVAGTWLAAFVIAAAACGGTPGSPAAASVAPSVEIITLGLPPTEPPASAPAATLAPPSPAGAVVEDPSLLSILPADLDGIAVAHEGQAFTDALADKAFVANVEAAAFGVVVDGEDLASAVVARLNPGLFSDAFFRGWRDSYDEGACGQAGGVVGNAESVIGKQTVYIGTCAEGLHTYHTWIEDRGVLVSAFSLGDRRFGEQLMAGLRP